MDVYTVELKNGLECKKAIFLLIIFFFLFALSLSSKSRSASRVSVDSYMILSTSPSVVL